MIVTFKTQGSSGTYVLVDGVVKAYISPGAERYISVSRSGKPWPDCGWNERETIARFKHNHPMNAAKQFCRVVFSVLDMPTVVELIKTEHLTPRKLQEMIESGHTFD